MAYVNVVSPLIQLSIIFVCGGNVERAPLNAAAIAAPEFLPFWGWILLTGIWNLVVALFYLPHRTCVELGYFQIAKETSGAGSRPFVRNSFGDDTEDPDRFN